VRFRCKRCGAEILPQDVDAQRLIAKCRACNTLFDAYGASDGTALVPSKRSRARAPKPPEDVTFEPGRRPAPAGYRVALGAPGVPLRVTLPSSRSTRQEGCGWTLYIVVAGAIVIGIAHGDIRGAMAIIAGVLVAGVSYVLLAGLVNTTTVTADETALSVVSGPIPILRPVHIPSSSIEQLFVVDGRQRSVLVALLRDGTQRPLVMSERGEDLLFIEREVERRLSIEDQPVPATGD
jgi:hypothetical protein